MLLVALVGNSDLTLDGAYLFQRNHAGDAPSFRDRTAALSAEYTAARDRLDAPLLLPQLRWLLGRQAEDATAPIDLVLIATDQQPPHPQDTVYAAELLARWLPERFPPGTLAVRVETIAGENPADYDAMYRWFRAAMRRLASRFPAGPAYLSVTGGTPAMTFGLTLHGVEAFGNRSAFLYLPRGADRPVRLGVRRELQRAQLLADARLLLERGDFAHAAELLREAGMPRGTWTLAQAAAHRLAFDFEEAAKLVRRHALREPRTRQAGEWFLGQLERLQQAAEQLEQEGTERAVPQAYEPLLSELVANLRHCWDAGRYADFLARLFRFQEALLRWLVEEQLGIPVHTEDGSSPPGFRRALQARPDLRRLAEARNLNVDRITRPLLVCLLQTVPAVRRDLETLEALNRLTLLRGQTIVAHGFRGVSRGRLLETYRQVAGPHAEPMADVEALAERLRLSDFAGWPERLRAELARLADELEG